MVFFLLQEILFTLKTANPIHQKLAVEMFLDHTGHIMEVYIDDTWLKA